MILVEVDEGQCLQFYDGDIDYKGMDEDQNDNEESSGYSDYSADDCVKSKLHIYEDDSDDFEDVGAYDPQEGAWFLFGIFTDCKE